MASLKKLFRAAHNQNSLVNDVLIESLIYKFFYHLLTEYPEQNKLKSKNSNEELQLAINYLEQNYINPACTITSVCHELDISRSYLYNIFRQNLNLTPSQFLTQLRMEKAKQNLLNSSYTVQQIANTVGYGDEFTFSKAFKRYTGLSPKFYRKKSNH